MDPRRLPALVLCLCVLTLVAVAPSAQAASCGSTEYADGTYGPTICPDGQPNEAVQGAYAKGTPAIMALKASAARAQVQRAVCRDRKAGASAVELYDSVEYQASRFEWSRAVVHPVMRRLVADKYC